MKILRECVNNTSNVHIYFLALQEIANYVMKECLADKYHSQNVEINVFFFYCNFICLCHSYMLYWVNENDWILYIYYLIFSHFFSLKVRFLSSEYYSYTGNYFSLKYILNLPGSIDQRATSGEG